MLTREFFARSVHDVAPELVGATFLFDGAGGVIVEVEAYDEDDPAAHSFRGLTARNASMFGPPGHAYVYRSYGIHWCINLVCEREGRAAAVLIRALEPLEGIDERTNGPGLLCRALDIDRRLNGADLEGDTIYLEDRGTPLRDDDIVARPRIGIKFAGEPWISQPWRYYERGNRWVSKR